MKRTGLVSLSEDEFKFDLSDDVVDFSETREYWETPIENCFSLLVRTKIDASAIIIDVEPNDEESDSPDTYERQYQGISVIYPKDAELTVTVLRDDLILFFFSRD